MSVWNPDNIRDWAEAVGIPNCDNEVVDALCGDVEFRISQILEEALKSMRHSKRSVLHTQDISTALRTLDIEPLYGYESTRPLRFGEASIGPGQPLYYIEDEEVDFEKLINAPLPKIPREIAFTAHWLAIEGVQPSIPQNPSSTTSSSQQDSTLPKPHPSSTGLPSSLTNGPPLSTASNNPTIKPLTKHVLSQELRLYFSTLTSALLDASSDEYRAAALASLRSEPGLHQLVPYFVQFVAEKVTHDIKNLFTLTQTMYLIAAMLENPHLYLDPYISALIPSILTCLVGRSLGPPLTLSSSIADHLATYPLRDLAASLFSSIARKYGTSSQTLKPRLARTCLKHFLDPSKPLATNYGGVVGLLAIGGGGGGGEKGGNASEMTRSVIIPNLKTFGDLILREALHPSEGEGGSEERREGKRKEADVVARTLIKAIAEVEEDDLLAGSNAGKVSSNLGAAGENGVEEGADSDAVMAMTMTNGEGEALMGRLREKAGETMAEKVAEIGGGGLVQKLLRLLEG